MSSKQPKFTFRANCYTLEKLRYISDDNFHTVNEELKILVKKHIEAYEKEHGPIPINEKKGPLL